MEFRQLGRSGLTVSSVGLGGNNFGVRCDAERTKEIVEAALDEGITLFDTADVYGEGRSEEFLGAALAGRRDEVVISTKFGNPPVEAEARTSRRYVRLAVERSLRKLQTEWIDLYQIHGSDARTPIEETLSTLDDLIREGKVRYGGSSMFAPWELVEAELLARIRGVNRMISTQTHYNLLHRNPEPELRRACTRYGIGILPFFPLASGLLTGKYRRGRPVPTGTRLAEERRHELTDERLDQVERIAEFAEGRDLSVLEVAVGWLAAQPAVASVIAGATNSDQVRSNVAAARWVPSADDLAALDEIIPPPGPDLHRARPAWVR